MFGIKHLVDETMEFVHAFLENFETAKSTKGQLFQFNGAFYVQTDGVAMGSPLGPLLANVFMSSLEEKLEPEGKLPDYHRRYVDDTLTIMRNITRARTS